MTRKRRALRIPGDHSRIALRYQERIRLVRPEPDNLEIISYDKAQNVERKTFMGTWEVTGMVVSVKEPRMTLPLGRIWRTS